MKPGELFVVWIVGESGGQIIQINEKERSLRRMSAYSLPTGPTLIPFSLTEVILASGVGMKLVNINSNEYMSGVEVEALTLEFPQSKN